MCDPSVQKAFCALITGVRKRFPPGGVVTLLCYVDRCCLCQKLTVAFCTSFLNWQFTLINQAKNLIHLIAKFLEYFYYYFFFSLLFICLFQFFLWGIYSSWLQKWYNMFLPYSCHVWRPQFNNFAALYIYCEILEHDPLK